MFRQHPFLSVVTFLYLGLVGLLTLGPQPLDEGTDSLVWRILAFFTRYPSLHLTYSSLEFLANVAMFIPVGLFFLLLLGRRRWWLAIVLGVALTCSIEAAQLVIPGRVSDYRDVVSNSVGATVGVVIALMLTWPAAIRRARERRLRARTA